MNQPRPCGCKGCRTCLFCEKTFNIEFKKPILNYENGAYIYCPSCEKAWPGWNPSDNVHPNHTGQSIKYPGIYIKLDFLSSSEESQLIESLDQLHWDLSQSGRRKQNFGPKCNFKKRKIAVGNFKGFPKSTKFVQVKFESEPIMKGFQTIEQCSLEYDPNRGASIDPHIDDCWIWGERIVTVNLLSNSVLTMTCNNKYDKYNLDCVESYPSVLKPDSELNLSKECYKLKYLDAHKSPIVRIPMPKRSLLVMYGAARYDWEHQVLREDISDRRVCLAYREFTPPYLQGGSKYEIVRSVYLNALNYLDDL